MLSALVALWLLRDAWRSVQGALHYAQGNWYWQQESKEIAGTCALHLDLQNYLLVSFKPYASNNKILPITTQWFHLEAKRGDSAASQHAWLALRRAIYSPSEPGFEALVYEKRVA